VSQPQAIRRLQRTQGAAYLSFGASGVRRWREDGAAKVRLPRRPTDAPAEAILINTAGGLTGGDSLTWTLDADGTRLVATTQAAEKIYRSLGDDAEILTRLTGKSGAAIHWLPQEAILFDGARLRRTLEVDLDGGATLFALEATVFGRQAMGETIQDLAFHDRWRVRRAADRCWSASPARISWSSRSMSAGRGAGSSGRWRASFIRAASGRGIAASSPGA